VTGYFAKALAAHLRTGKTLFLLTWLGVAIGVGSVLSIQILNRNALGAFEGSLRAVSGDTELTVLPHGPALRDEDLDAVLAQPDVIGAYPLWRTDVALAGRDRYFLEIVGADLFAAARIPWSSTAPRGELEDVLARPGWAAVTPELAAEMGWTTGSRFEVTSGTRRVTLTVGALVDFRKLTPLASRRLVVMDLAQAQDRFGGAGELTQIDVDVRDGGDVEGAARGIEARLNGRVSAATPEQRRLQAAGLLGAFRLNLTALSFISLFVGAFLIYAATQAALVRRRGEFGLLRALGATPRQVLALILAEVTLLAVLGVAAGVPLGIAAARANVATVSDTISNLYMLEEIERLVIPPWTWLLAAALGLGGVLAGAMYPALEMARRDPRELLAAYTLHETIGAAARRLALAAVVFLVAAAGVAAVMGKDWRPGGFVLAVGLLVAMPLATPAVLRAVASRLRVRSFSWVYGLRTLGTRLGTTAVAVAALAVAVSMLVGITLMVGSFRRTVELWIDDSLRGDVFVTTASWERARREAGIEPEIERALRELPGVIAVDRLRQVFVAYRGRRIMIGGAGLGAPEAVGRFTLVEGDPGTALDALRGGGALVSEPLARKEKLAVGDVLRVQGTSGEAAFPIAGIFYDYSSEVGGAVVGLDTFAEVFGPGAPTNLALYLEPGRDAEATVDAIRAVLPDAPLLVRSNRTLRTEVFAIFDRTFAVTRLLQGMALVVAVCGITLTLLILARQKVSELALYRALGAGRGQIFRVFLGQGLGIAGFGLALGSAGGIVLALILVYLINRAWFGWTIAMAWPWGALGEQVATIIAAAALASVYPALRASRTPATELSRDDL